MQAQQEESQSAFAEALVALETPGCCLRQANERGVSEEKVIKEHLGVLYDHISRGDEQLPENGFKMLMRIRNKHPHLRFVCNRVYYTTVDHAFSCGPTSSRHAS